MPFDFLGSCVDITLTPREFCIRYPVGQEICQAIPQLPMPDLAEVLAALFDKLNAALGPLKQILDIVDVAIATFECIKGIPDAIIKLDPTTLIECIPGLAEAVDKILGMIPILSLPLMILDIITFLIQYLEAQKAIIARALARADAVIAAATKAADPGQFALSSVIDCINANFSIQIQNISEMNAPLNRIIGQINFFLDLLGLPCIPAIPSLTNLDLATAIIDFFIDFLRGLIFFIPSFAPPTSEQEDCEPLQLPTLPLPTLP